MQPVLRIYPSGSSRLKIRRTFATLGNILWSIGGILPRSRARRPTGAMLIISTGIIKVIAQRRYHAAQETREMFKLAGVELVIIEDEIETYENQ